jgi:hypothetical protein
LGKLSRDSGHMRVPDPPHMITGLNLGISVSVVSLVQKPVPFWTKTGVGGNPHCDRGR